MPVYLNIESRVDERAAAAAARKLIEQFSHVGNQISRDMGKSLSGALSAVDGSAARAQLMELQAEYRRLADAEADAAARMVRSMGQVEVAQRRLQEVTAKYTAESSQAARANVALADAHAVAAKAQRDQVYAADAVAAAHTKLGKSADDAGTSLTTLQKLGSSPIVNAVGIGSVAAFGTAAFEAGKKAGDFQQQMIRLQASAGETGANLKTVSDGILNLAGQVGYSASDLANGMYTVEKAGYRGGDGLKVLQSAAQLAKAENADLGEVLNGLTTSMNDYNIPVSQAADLASKLNVAVGMAKTTLQDFSGALHSVEPVAMTAHVGIDQVYGDLARLTQSGMSPDQGSQNLAQTIRNFMGPNAQMRDALGKLGLSAHQLQVEMGDPSVGLNGVLKQVSDRIRSLAGPDGQVAVSAFYKNVDATNALSTAYQALSPQAKGIADQLNQLNASGGAAPSGLLKELRTEAKIDPQLKQWMTMRTTVDGLSSNLKKLQPDLETVQQLFKETTGGSETLNVLAQLYGNPDEAQKTADAVNQVGSATADAKGDVKGFSDVQKGLNAQMSDAKAAFGAAATKLGDDFIPAITLAARGLHDVADVLEQHPALAEAAATAVGLFGGAWLAIKGYNIASTVLGPIATGIGTLITRFGAADTAAATAATTMRGMGAAAQEGVAGVEAAAAEEVAAEERVTASAGGARGALGGIAAAAGPLGIAAAGSAAADSAFTAADHGLHTNFFTRFAEVPGSGAWVAHQLFGSHAAGGPLHAPGPKGTDSALFWGAEGEHVLTADDVDAAGGHAGVYAWRAALHRQYGGPVGDDGSPMSRLYQEAESLNGGNYVWGSTDCCLIGSTMVYGPDGPKRISELSAGDEIYSYDDGKTAVRRVKAAWQSETQPVFKVRTRNRAVVASANHPFMRLVQVERRRPGNSLSRWDVEWARLDELKPGDLLVQPNELRLHERTDAELPDGTLVTDDVAWLLGAIVGDGTVKKNSFQRRSRARRGMRPDRTPGIQTQRSIALCLFGEKRDRAQRIIRETWDVHNFNRNDHHGLQFHKATLVDALLDMGFEHRGQHKRIPESVWHWGEKLQRAFLDGYCDADGYRPKDKARNEDRSYSSCSERLIGEVRALHIMLGDPVSNVTVNQRTKPIVIKGKTVKNALPLHVFTVYLPRPSRYGAKIRKQHPGAARWMEANDFTVTAVRSIVPMGVEDTYDIEVETNHNFIADGFVVHNSGAVSQLVDAALGTTGRMSTATASSWLAEKGFQPGSMPGAFNIGWYNGGPGGGHMAATLPDGTHFESGGQHGGIELGGDAAGAESSEFTNHMYLPMQGLYPDGPAGSGGGMGGASPQMAAADDRLARAQEHLSVAKQHESEVDADPKAKASAREKAKDEVADAERQVAAAERGRAAAIRQGSSGGRGGSPFLPVPLAGRFGLSKGLPGLAEWAVGFMEDMVLGPIETGVMAALGGSPGGQSGGLLSMLSGGGGAAPFTPNVPAGTFGPGSHVAGPVGGGGGAAAPAGGGSDAASATSNTGAPVDINGPLTPDQVAQLSPDQQRKLLRNAFAHPTPAPAPPGPPPPPPPKPGTQAWLNGLLTGSPQGMGPGFTPGSGLGPDDNNIPGLTLGDLAGPAAKAWRRGVGDLGDLFPGGMAPLGAPRPGFRKMPVSPYTPPPAPPPPPEPGLPPDVADFFVPGAQHHAKGGPIGTDTVPAWLSPGEEVERVSAVQKYGQSFMDRLNAGQVDPNVRYFGTGGGVPAPLAPAPGPPPAPPKAPPPPPKPPQEAMKAPTKPPVGKPIIGSIHAGSPLPGGKPQGDQTHAGLQTPDASQQLFGQGLPASQGIGFGGGLLGAAEGAASQAAGMAASMGTFGAGGGAASSATQLMFQMMNRTAAYFAQDAGIGVEALLETFLPADSPLSNFSNTLPGKLLAGVAGVRPAAPNTAGKTAAPLTGHKSGSTQGGDSHYHFHENSVNLKTDHFEKTVGEISDQALRSQHSSAANQRPFSGTP